MDNIVEVLIRKRPRFPEKYEHLFERFARKGGGSEEVRLEKAKIFRNYYELYIYAFFLGLRRSKQFNIEQVKMSKQNALTIEEWKPAELRDYLVACVLAEANIPLRDYDQMIESEIAEKSRELRKILEEYTCGGLSIIDDQFKEDKQFFIETFAFTEFVFE